MIQLFKSLLGKPAKNLAPKNGKSGVRAGARAGAPVTAPLCGLDYRAVSLVPNIECEAVAKYAAGSRYLMREAPTLPLPNCATPATCSCRFRKHADRREGDRRLLGMTATNRWFVESERRRPGGRRAH